MVFWPISALFPARRPISIPLISPRARSRQLVQDPAQTIDPIWSPDGKYLLYIGISWVPPYGPSYVAFHPMDGLWAVRVSDGVAIPQPAPEGTYQNLLGWSDDSHYLMYDSDKQCLARNLRSVDVTTGQETPIVDFCFFAQPAWSPENRSVIFSIDSELLLFVRGRDVSAASGFAGAAEDIG